MASESEAKQLANDVLALATGTLTSIELITQSTYTDDGERQILLGYMSVLLVKMAMDNTIDNIFQEPLEFRMNCLDAVKEIYETATE